MGHPNLLSSLSLALHHQSSFDYILPTPIMAINFPLTEGKKKDEAHLHKDRPEYKAFKACFPRSEDQPMMPDLRATCLAREAAAPSGLRHGWLCSLTSKAWDLGRSCLSSWRPSVVACMACVLCPRPCTPMRVASLQS